MALLHIRNFIHVGLFYGSLLPYTQKSCIHRRRKSDWNNYDCQNFQQVYTGVPVHIKHVFTGVSNFHTSFHLSKRSPRHSKDLSGKLIVLEIGEP